MRRGGERLWTIQLYPTPPLYCRPSIGDTIALCKTSIVGMKKFFQIVFGKCLAISWDWAG